MGFGEDISVTFNRVKTDVRDLFSTKSKSDNNRNINSGDTQCEKPKNKPKPITKKHSSDHPLFNSSSPRGTQLPHPLSKSSTSSPRKHSDPRELYKGPVQLRLRAARTSSVPLQGKERVSRTTSLPAVFNNNPNNVCPVHPNNQSHNNLQTNGESWQFLRAEKSPTDVDCESYISGSSEHIYEEIAEVEEREDMDPGDDSFLLSISMERRNRLREFGRADWD